MRLMLSLAFAQYRQHRYRAVLIALGIALSTAILVIVSKISYSLSASLLQASNRPYFGEIAMGIEMTIYSHTVMFMMLVALIILFSIIILTNAFQLGASERMRQMGILKSVGATRRQIRYTMSAEALVLSAIGIPVGVLLGNAGATHLIRIMNRMLSPFADAIGQSVLLSTDFFWPSVVAPMVLALMITFMSAQIPAIRISHLPALVAIRGQVKAPRNFDRVRRNAQRRSDFLQKMFGVEGKLAFRLFRHNRAYYRSAVVYGVASIALIMGVHTAGFYLERVADVSVASLEQLSATVEVNLQYQDHGIHPVQGQVHPELSHNRVSALTDRLKRYPDTELIGISREFLSYQTYVLAEMLSPEARSLFPELANSNRAVPITVNVISLDLDSYQKLCMLAGVPFGSNILINHQEVVSQMNRTAGEVWTEFAPLQEKPPRLSLAVEGSRANDAGQSTSLELKGELRSDSLSNEMKFYISSVLPQAHKLSVSVVVLHNNAYAINWYANPADQQGFMVYAEQLISDAQQQDFGASHGNVSDLKLRSDFIRYTTNTIVFGFMGVTAMLIAAGLTSLASVVAANLRTRSRELVMLKTLGLGKKELTKTLYIEGVFYTWRILTRGLVAGVAMSYLSYVLISPWGLAYEFPWLIMLACILATLVVIWGAVYMSAYYFNNANVIEVVNRADIGM